MLHRFIFHFVIKYEKIQFQILFTFCFSVLTVIRKQTQPVYFHKLNIKYQRNTCGYTIILTYIISYHLVLCSKLCLVNLETTANFQSILTAFFLLLQSFGMVFLARVSTDFLLIFHFRSLHFDFFYFCFNCENIMKIFHKFRTVSYFLLK